MEDMNVSNASEEVVTPQIDETVDNTEVAQEEITETVEDTTTETESVNEDVAEPQGVVRTAQTAEQNSMYAKIRREAEAKAEARARDSVIAEMGMSWNDKPITTYQEYQQALREQQLQQEAERQGVDPQFYVDFKNMQDELSSYKRNSAMTQQDTALANDPLVGEFYKEWKDEVHDLANQYNCDLDTAFTFLTRNKLGEILNKNSKKIQNETITKISSNSKTTPGALGAANDQPSVNAWDMSDADFEKMMARASRGELKRY